MEEPIRFETEPCRYRHWKLEAERDRARLLIKVDENGGLRPGYALKLNSYDLGVDIELADAVMRLRFEHPGVSVVTLSSATEGMFCAGANIFMLARSEHGFKVNFCKFTNETRLAIEDASRHSGQRYLAALNGTCSGGGYELALACDELILVDDRRSAVSLPEIPYLGVLPGTGGLIRLVDKRKVRRDLADLFVTLAEGVRGERAVKWGLVDAIAPRSRFDAAVEARVEALVDPARAGRAGITLDALSPAESDEQIRYRHLTLRLERSRRLAEMIVEGPAGVPAIPAEPAALGADFYPLRLFREIDDALLRLRCNYPEIGLVLIRSQGELERVLELERRMWERRADWFINETILLMKRVLKRLDLTAKSFFALVEPGACFGGGLLELALAADRIYMKSGAGARIATGPLNAGALPMSNGLSRLQTRFVADPAHAVALASARVFDADEALEAGLATVAPDELDWEEELRLAISERLSLSPDALTAMEASIRFAGPETMETRIFGRLSAWQNWIFQRPNAVGEHGALRLYGQPQSPQFDFRRT
ncbi:MAG TPA: 2,3-epoxybenzoyl-CoA dihydrolase [Candidatus Binataceae bacterium]|jgi:benzoyl-CoA-dihydrodiol lyase|nr:2,3-epoxybenzoyl-CoA dihydrolase [Candidatus Binataceae bacterium]